MENPFKRKPEKDLLISGNDMFLSMQRGISRGIKTEDSMVLPNFISKARKSKNLTIDELSQISNISSNDLIDLECRQLHLSEMVTLCESLKDKLEFDEKKYKLVLLLQMSGA